MKNKLLLVLAGILLLGASCGNKTTVKTNYEKTETKQSEKGQKSFKELAMLGKNLKCEAKFMSQGSETQGTIYSSKGKLASSFNTKVEGKNIKSNMLIDGDFMYSWTDQSNMGFKAEVNAKDQNSNTQKGQTDAEQKIDYSCEEWDEDRSIFELPKNIEFKDLSSVTQTLPGAGSAGTMDTKTLQCQACDQAPADQKAACLSALKCN